MKFFVPFVTFVLSAPAASYESDVRAYLAEARELSERLGVIEAAEFKERYDRTLELYAKILRGQGQTERNKEIAFLVSRIGFHFSVTQVLVNRRHQYLRSGQRQRARSTHAKLRGIERDQLRRIAELKRLLQADKP